MLTAAIIYVLLYSLLLFSCSRSSSSNSESDYQTLLAEVKGAETHMPSIASLGNYDSVSVHRKTTKYILGETEAITLSVTYTGAAFDEAKAQIGSRYTFLSANTETLQDIYAEVDGYAIKIVAKEEKLSSSYAYLYPKCFLLIGINEETQSIIYMYHYDIDLDKIDNLDKFVKKHYVLSEDS